MSKPSKQVSEIDRLIELASNEKPGAAVLVDHAASSVRSLTVGNQKDPPSMWRLLIQLRVLLPYLAKVLPLVERGLLGTNITGHAASGVDTSRLDRSIAGVGEVQRDLNTAVRNQGAEIKLLQEEVNSLGKSIEKSVLVNEELVASLTSIRKLVTTSAWVIFVLLLLLIGLAAFAVFGRVISPR